MNRRLLTVRAAQVGLLLVVAAIALAALVQGLVWGKEGFGIEDLGTVALGLAGLAVTGLTWWAASRRGRNPLPVPVAALGLALLALPFSCFATIAVSTAISGVRGARLAREVRVTRYAETPLTPAGLEGPIGLRVELTLAHPAFPSGNLFPPRLVLVAPGEEPGDYFALPFSHPGRWMLERPLMQQATDAEQDRRVLAEAGSTDLAYDLYAATVRVVSPAGQICLEPTAAPVADSAASAVRVAAVWVFHASHGLSAQLGPALSRTLAESSRFASRPAAWKEMVARATAERLGQAGYSLCASENALLAPGACWCPPTGG